VCVCAHGHNSRMKVVGGGSESKSEAPELGTRSSRLAVTAPGACVCPSSAPHTGVLAPTAHSCCPARSSTHMHVSGIVQPTSQAHQLNRSALLWFPESPKGGGHNIILLDIHKQDSTEHRA
jgi:hypothetical protein